VSAPIGRGGTKCAPIVARATAKPSCATPATSAAMPRR
jgi:hypothetical protein